MPAPVSDKVKICIDRGGTFCDVIALSDTKGDHVVKLLSVDPDNYADAPTEGVRRVLEWFTGEKIPRNHPIDTSPIEYLRMGTTVATNALLERMGEKCALLINKGHADALEIAFQTRPYLFQLAVKKPDVLYTKVVEIDERIIPEWFEFVEEGRTVAENGDRLIKTPSGVTVRELKPLDEAEVIECLRSLYAEGFRSLAIVLAHSYLLPDDEQRIAKVARDMGFDNVSVSSDIEAKIGFIARGQSTTADAYLTPEVKRYLSGFAKGFKGKLEDAQCRVSFMQSDGALADFKKFSGLRAILSGPAGGVVGFARTSYDRQEGSPVVGFDMGGTSTDVSRFSGTYEHVFETTTAGISISVPQLDINTVAAGGGSILTYRNQMFNVGPESAGAHPGPAAYRKGGPLTVTDANLFLGRLHIDSFPKIFGPTEDMPLDYEIVRQKFEELTEAINKENGSSLSPAEVASGFLNVANSSMARPIRALTEQRGFRTSAHNLSCFGGAGGQHATALAALLGMHNVIVHKYSSILSAYGMAMAEVAVDVSEPFVQEFSKSSIPTIEGRFEGLKTRALKQLQDQGVSEDTVVYDCYLNLQYAGSDTTLMILRPEDDDFSRAFVEEHKREFAFTLDSPVMVAGVRVRATSKGTSTDLSESSPYYEELKQLENSEIAQPEPKAFAINSVYFEEIGQFTDIPLYKLQHLTPGAKIAGPAIILDNTQTIVLHPQNVARILKSHVFIDVGLGPRKEIDLKSVDPIQLSIFSHRFMGIAEQMCRALQKTAVSVSIKERLDFSCALFDANGELVANAPNVPAHLGSMQYAVTYQAERRKGQLKPGDLLVSNIPEAGGGHLPDITIIQPVFDDAGREIVFWVAARGHHTDIGGLEGNSHHPNQIDRLEEGVAFESTFIVRDGIFNEQEIVDTFMKAGDFPNCKPTKRIEHNLSDLKAQCSACAVGTTQLHALFDEYGKDVVHFYMKAIRDNAEACTRDALKPYAGKSYQAVDHFDDGTVVKLKIDVHEDGSGTFDFTGTGPEVLANFNAPPAITRSGLLYCLRTMSGTDIPMNAGVLAPLKIIIPEGSVLSASEDAAVSQGNGEVAQRVADIVFTAFNVMSGSHGSMNGTHLMYKKYTWAETSECLLMHEVNSDTYVTLSVACGGASAGPTWDGQSAVHTNMTNTRIGDLELLETRFPAILREFSIRRGTGGAGQHRGGDGICRIYEALVPMDASHDGQRRVIVPHGTEGGLDGEVGASYLKKRKRAGGFRIVKLKPAHQISMLPGEQLIVHTAGAGGWGTPADAIEKSQVGKSIYVSNKEGSRPPPFTRANGSVSQWGQAQAECD
ncbi:5-oxoprolinase (ATP-hydrolysing) [Kwoniella heveanensis BCC8398]|uniref:5-oxoprolinase (ATP-hydrolysing) n=1 Tax=Kwoniella heveanensis BCC8398 TaxID=1296120 RepID=A0A1B9GUJ9_9TREE|nr:5-oxoprolinase (ATP-hydrolysing) [Kwoniella heveanensis BCC8398]